MKDWTGIAVIVLALVLFALYSLIRDKDPKHMNPRRELAEERNKWEEFQRANFVVLILAFLGAYVLVRLVEWVWRPLLGGEDYEKREGGYAGQPSPRLRLASRS
jgi:magnesium-transporting ATPase (P-type)